MVYLVFNEGYATSGVGHLLDVSLTDEAIRLARQLRRVRPDDTEVGGLLALMLLTDARRVARTDAAGDLVPLEHQDRSRWDGHAIAEGVTLLEDVLPKGQAGPFQIQAAIAAIHAEAPDAAATDWSEIVGLYDALLRADSSPVVELNRAVAVAMRDGPAAGLVVIDAILDRGDLLDYRLAHASRAELCRRLGNVAEARVAFERAIALTRQAPERRFLERRLAELQR